MNIPETLNILPSTTLRGTISLPASKSLSNRALLISALCADPNRERPKIQNLADCDDTRVMREALATLPPVIDIGAAGTAMRFLTAYLAVTPGSHIITGTERMRHRPIGILVDALRMLGAQVDYEGAQGFPPLRITGQTLRGGTLQMAGDVSSQYVSALLMIGPVLSNGLTLELRGEVVSRPYIEMTISLMRTFGARVEWLDGQTICVNAGGYRPTEYRVENDWSAASYWYEMMALSSDEMAEICLPGLQKESLQGDSAVREMFQGLGVRTDFVTQDGGCEVVRLTRSRERVACLELDFTHQPDLAQALVVSCALSGVPFRFTGLQSLRIKETDRIHALSAELRRLGYVIGDEDDSVLFWTGERCARETLPSICTYEDHRMAMAFAPACLAVGPLCINRPEVVSKSYPQFWQHLGAVGFKLRPPF